MNNCRHCGMSRSGDSFRNSQETSGTGVKSHLTPVRGNGSPGVRMGVSLGWTFASCPVMPPDCFLQQKDNLCDSAVRDV